MHLALRPRSAARSRANPRMTAARGKQSTLRTNGRPQPSASTLEDANEQREDRKSTRLNQSPDHLVCRLLLEKKNQAVWVPDNGTFNPADVLQEHYPLNWLIKLRPVIGDCGIGVVLEHNSFVHHLLLSAAS